MRSTEDLEEYLRAQLATLNVLCTATFKQVRQNAASGCLLFEYFLQATESTIRLLADGATEVERNDRFKPFPEHLHWEGRRVPEADERLLICTESRLTAQSSTFRFRWFVHPYQVFHCMHIQAPAHRHGCHISDDWVDVDPFQLIVDWESSYPHFVPKMIDCEPGSDRSLASVRKFCERYGDPKDVVKDAITENFVPDRLLSFDTSKPTQVRLVEGQSLAEPARYVALSYCWGGDQRFKLTKESKEHLFGGFAFGYLPSTLKDAVTVEATFGFSHLWVDALCIIQNDDEDLGRQLAVRAQIYESAALTIAASRAKSVEEGFLQDRLPFKDTAGPPFLLRCSHLKEDNNTEPCLCFPAADLVDYAGPPAALPHDATVTWEDEPRDPLVRHAWTFQERALSRVLVDFGVLGTRGRAFHLNATYNYGDGRKYWEAKYIIPFRPQIVNELSILPPEYRLIAIFEVWVQALEVYSSLDLSFQSDRLPAISAIARHFAASFGGEDNYLAGIWRGTLPLGLLWMACTPRNDETDELQDSYAAPSWSWASVRHPIRYLENVMSPNFETDQGVEALECTNDLKLHSVKLGAMEKGRLRLWGRLLPVTLFLEKSLDIGWSFGEGRSELAGSYVQAARGDGKFLNKRGLYRLNYDQPDKAYRDTFLSATIIIDRSEAVVKQMTANSKCLYLLPIVSGLVEKKEPGIDEQVWGIEMPAVRPISGLLLMEKSDGVFTRLAMFNMNVTASSRLFDDHSMDIEKVPDLFLDQYQWIQGGELQEFVLM